MPGPVVRDPAKIAAVRAAVPATQRAALLNAGTSGPLPLSALRAMQAQLRRDVRRGRHTRDDWELARATRERLRERLGALVGGAPGSVALSHHTTDGMNIVIHGINWRPGDEAVTTTLEHISGLLPLAIVRERYGVLVRYADIGYGEDAAHVVAQLERAITGRTRLVVLSHVSYSSGARLPLDDIVAMAHGHGVPVAVDGAQSVGAIPLDLAASGVDYYAFPGQKWLCGPDGTGGLYVRPERIQELYQTYGGYASLSQHDDVGRFLPQPDARRFEIAGTLQAGALGLEASLAWLLDDVGLAWAHARIAHLAALARERLSALDGVEVVSPPPLAGLVSFRVAAVDWREAPLSLWRRERVQIRSIQELGCLRVATGFYNTEDEIERLVGGVARLRAGRR